MTTDDYKKTLLSDKEMSLVSLAPPPEALIGTMIDDRYQIESLLGEGGMGAVYKANHIKMGKKVAIKLIHEELSHINDVARRFEREAQSSSKLTDPHCISVTDFGKTQDNKLYLVMELLEGEDLDTRLQREDFSMRERTVDVTTKVSDLTFGEMGNVRAFQGH